jgi:predicted O-methyltransferase YrrM
MTRPAYSDPQLLEWTINLSKKYKIDVFFETGSYLGESARIVAPYFSKVFTVENDLQNYKIAEQTLKEITNCELILGNSPEIIRSKSLTSNTFFFLDAHWEEYWPLLDELFEIKKKQIIPVIAIHDFFVPDENENPKFGYDIYRGQPLNLSYVNNSLDEIYGKLNYTVTFSTSSLTNSGVAYITPQL